MTEPDRHQQPGLGHRLFRAASAFLRSNPSSSEDVLMKSPTNFASSMPPLDFCPPELFHAGGVNLPLEHLCSTAISGDPGSTKSAHAKLTTLSLLQNFRHGLGSQFFALDPAREYLDLMSHYLPQGSMRYIEPMDRVRTARWLMFKTLKSVAESESLGRMFAPVNSETREPFFEDMCANCWAGAFASEYITRGQEGDERDVVAMMQSPEAIKAGLALAPQHNAARLKLYFGNASKGVNRDVLATIANRISDVSAAFDSWRGARDTFDLDGWERGDYGLCLGLSFSHPEATKALWRALVSSLERRILSRPDSFGFKTLFVLDELPLYGRWDVPRLLSLSRHKGLVAIVTYQDRGLMLQEYGPNMTQSLNGLTPFKIICRTTDIESAEQSSRQLGEVERLRWTRNFGHSSGREQSSSEGGGQVYDRARLVTPEDIQNLQVFGSGERPEESHAFVVSPALRRKYECVLHLDLVRRHLPRGSRFHYPPDDATDDGFCGAAVPVEPAAPRLFPGAASAFPDPDEASLYE